MQYNNKNLYRAQWSTVVESEARVVAGRAKEGYTLRVVRGKMRFKPTFKCVQCVGLPDSGG